MVPGDNLMKIHKKTLRNLTAAFVTPHHMIPFCVERASFSCLFNGGFSAWKIRNSFPPSREMRQYYRKLKKAKLKHKLTHALGISPTLAPSKHDRRAAFLNRGSLRLHRHSGGRSICVPTTSNTTNLENTSGPGALISLMRFSEGTH